MLDAQRKRELLGSAEILADELANGEVSRAELRPVLNVLFLTPHPWPERLENARKLNDALPISWVTNRSGRSHPQFGLVGRVMRRVFEEEHGEEELRFLLGWTARLVHLKDLELQASQNGSGRNENRNGEPRRSQNRHA